MHALSCSSSLEESTFNPHLVTRIHKYPARLTIYDHSTGRRRACLDSDRCKEIPERFDLCVRDLERGEYRSDEEISSGWPFRK